jgi:hypothetical protein
LSVIFRLLSVYGWKNNIDLTKKIDLINNIYNDLSLIFVTSHKIPEGLPLITNCERASGMIKFLAGSCLSGLGIVLKEPYAI